MVLTFNASNYLGEMHDEFWTLDVGIREQVFLDACEFIEEELRTSILLRRYEWDGSVAFYNDQPYGKKERIPADHMCNLFIVRYNNPNFEVENVKYVTSSNGKNYNLVEDLLWKGFGPYSVGRIMKTGVSLSPELLAYLRRTKRSSSRTQSELYQPAGNLMNFYYRYKGKWFYKMPKRGGMDSGLVDKFHLYIHESIEAGVKRSIEMHLPEENRTLVQSGNLEEWGR